VFNYVPNLFYYYCILNTTGCPLPKSHICV